MHTSVLVPALVQALAMPLLEESALPQEHPPTVPVVVIGSLLLSSSN